MKIVGTIFEGIVGAQLEYSYQKVTFFNTQGLELDIGPKHQR